MKFMPSSDIVISFTIGTDMPKYRPGETEANTPFKQQMQYDKHLTSRVTSAKMINEQRNRSNKKLAVV